MNEEKSINYERIANLTDIQKDALREIGNIGAAHAATALSSMLKETIMIDVTSSHIIGIEDMQNELFGDPSDKVAGVFMQVTGSGTHNLLMLFPFENTLQLVDMFFKRPIGTSTELSSKDESAINEIGNVCACAYLNAMSDLLGITLFPTVPGLAVDMLGAVLQFPVLEIGRRVDYVIIIQTQFIRNADRFNGYFLFMPDDDVQKAIMDKFKINVK
ncbi:MAG: chemotaxis protein CheC [Thermoplasmata archaeon]|nr:chemotaxis protein CheC [Thermoplasmata archaeon]